MKVGFLKNSLLGMIASVATILTGFVMQRVMIDRLGIESAGFDSFLKNTISVLSIGELGFASAINFHLYGVLKRDERGVAASILLYFRKVYRVVCLIVLAIGAVGLPFIPALAGATEVRGFSVQLCFVIIVLDTAVSYLLVYKRSILIAGERNYVVNTVHSAALIAMTATQIGLVIWLENLYVYFILKGVFAVVENLVINALADRYYPWYRTEVKGANPIDEDTKASIWKQVKGLIYHRLATFVVLGSDSIILTYFLGLEAAGRYSNYYLILGGLQSVCSGVFVAITPSIGVELLQGARSQRSQRLFGKLLRVNLAIGLTMAVGYFVVIDAFIANWVGSEFIETTDFKVMMAALGFVYIMRSAFNAVKEALGIFYEDRYVAVIEALVNVVAGIVFVQWLGLFGIPLATTISTMVLYGWTYYRFAWKKIFGPTGSLYLVTLGAFCIGTAAVAVVVEFVARSLVGQGVSIFDLVIRVGVSILITSFVSLVIYKSRRLIRT